MTQTKSTRGKAAFDSGKTAEHIAAAWLRIKGYRIHGMRVRNAGGEIDLIVERDTIIVFCEVKKRTSVETALHSISPRQRARIERAAEIWLAEHPWATDLGVRFDVIALSAAMMPNHVKDAWRPQ